MENNCAMIGLKQEEEIELDLGLSIGGRFKRPEKLNQVSVKHEPLQLQRTSDLKASCFDTDLRENHQKFERMAAVDPHVKREIEALRRQEAKKKRQEKQQKKGTCINGGFGVVHENKMWLKSPELETKEPEFDLKERECKKSRVEDNGSGNNNIEMKNVNLNFTVEQNFNMSRNVTLSSNQMAYSPSTVCPVMYPYAPLQFVQFPNGFPYPCVNVVPLWANGGVGVGNEESVVQSLINQTFKPFQSGHEPGFNVRNGCASDHNSRKARSNGSPSCSSSLVSDCRSSSHEGGGSSDTRSHSIHSRPQHHHPLQGSKVNGSKGQSEQSASSHLRETAQMYDEATNCIKPAIASNNAQCSPATNSTTDCFKQKIQSNCVQFSPTKPKEEAASEPRAVSENPVSTAENPSLGLLKESKRGTGKPPKPQPQNQNALSLPQMPCVSTTGNGPNGKTINGFLYRYTKSEVSIICVCHGTSFSPAEFVQHAGGVDVSHPLRHINVIPSAF